MAWQYVLCVISLTCQCIATEIQLSQTAGSFGSPREGKTYPNHLNLTWVIQSPNIGQVVVLYFSVFEIEESYEIQSGPCVYDYVKIYGENDVMLSNLCGSSSLGGYDAPRLQREYIANNGRMVVNFVSDYSNENPLPFGFTAHYKMRDRDECAMLRQQAATTMEDWDELLYCDHSCVNTPGSYTCTCDIGYTLHENKHTCVANCEQTTHTTNNGTIAPKKRKNYYSKLANCDWKIKTMHGFSVYIRFSGDFGIEAHYTEGCVYDWVRYTTHNDENGPRYCGKSLPNNGDWIDTSSHEITIQFISDLTIESTGFTVEYKFERVTCDEILLAPANGEITTAGNRFEDIATYSCNIGYRLIGESERVCGADSQWLGFPPSCEIKRCQQPTHLANLKNGVIVTEPIKVTYGSQVKTECYIWYELQSGSQLWTCGDDEEWHPENPIPNQDNIPVCTEICGLKGNEAVLNGSYDFGSAVPKDEPEEAGIGGKILDGKPAKPGEWPWMAFLDIKGIKGLRENEDICGGSLVSPNVVVTAAHCFDSYSHHNTLVFLGAHNRNNVTDVNIQKIGVKTLHIDPAYNLSSTENDIAVLILKKAAVMGKFVRPICIPFRTKEKELPQRGITEKDGYQKSGVVAGWGMTTSENDPDEPESNEPASILQMVRIRAILLKQCKSDFENIKSKSYSDIFIADTMLCGGSLFSQKDSCTGDSGGPYMYKDLVTSRWFLNGIVSFGSTESCGLNTFGIYTNVAHYVEFISNFIGV